MTLAADKRTVLIYPGGTEIGLEIARSLKPCKEVRLISAGLTNTPAEVFFETHHEVQPVNSSEWLEQLGSVVRAEQVTHIMPAHDEVIAPLVESEGVLGAKVVTSCLDTCQTARSKTKTLKRLKGIVPVPELFKTSSAVGKFPVFLKPEIGQGSRGAVTAKTIAEMNVALEKDPSLVIQEYLPGEEYTVDCFSDRDRGVLYAAGRQRIKITSGIASHSRFVNDPRFGDYARRIQVVLPFRGAWFFQLKSSAEGELKLLEVAPRIGGTSGLSRVSGVNLPLLSLYESDRVQVSIPQTLQGVVVQRTLVPSYTHSLDYDALYLDYDDTLIVNGVVNTHLVKLAYQFLNKQKPVVLVTRHAGDIRASLRKHRLEGLFDKIRHLQAGESKRDAVEHKAAVFIDDSFRELEDLRQHPGLLVLHVSAADVLTDYRGI
jgi:carbamoyl-phosphate synthase large subunit